eukprot:529646-Prorocentrum_minimum.AAC.1
MRAACHTSITSPPPMVPSRAPACTAAPSATASSGFTAVSRASMFCQGENTVVKPLLSRATTEEFNSPPNNSRTISVQGREM